MKISVLKYLCLMGVLLVVVGCSDEGTATLTIVNQSSETIALLQVKVHEKIQTVKELKHGEEAQMQFPVKFDTHYHIDIEFISGRKTWEDIGYLTGMTRISDKITINMADIEFETMSVETPELY